MAESNTSKLTREELYERIWKTPATKVARELGITDVAMFYLCRNYDIPKPPKGYWSMVAIGRPSERPPLPEQADPDKQIIEISPEAVKLVATAAAQSDATSKIAPARIVVPDKLRSPHPLVERTNQALREAEPNYDGLVRPKWTRCLNVLVSKQEIGRAMRVLDTFIKAAIAKGMTIRVEEEKDERAVTYLTVDGADLKLRISERMGKREKKLSAEDRKRYASYGTGVSNSYLYEKHPSGDLNFALEGKFGNEKGWSEKDGKRLEERLDGILATAERLAVRVREDQKECDERQRQWKEEERLRKEAEERRRLEELRRAQLREQITRWERAEAIRAFIAAARARAGSVTPESDLAKWLGWADEYANRIDPLRDPVTELPNRRRKDSLPYNYTPELDP